MSLRDTLAMIWASFSWPCFDDSHPSSTLLFVSSLLMILFAICYFLYLSIPRKLTKPKSFPCPSVPTCSETAICIPFLTEERSQSPDIRLLKKIAAGEVANTANPVDKISISVKLDNAISTKKDCQTLVKEKCGHCPFLEEKGNVDEESGANMQTMLDFLHVIKEHKEDELNEMINVLQIISEDIVAVERHGMGLELKASEMKSQRRSIGCNRILKDLEECYLQKRQQKQDQCDAGIAKREGFCTELEDFQSILVAATKYSGLKVIAELKQQSLCQSANGVSSIDFGCDGEFFATAGTSRQIKVFNFSSVVNESGKVHNPVVSISTPSKLSCLSWNKSSKGQIASCDYSGVVTIWDMTNNQSIMEYKEHERRTWSVDFSEIEPSMLISGGDDGKVKVWSTTQEESVLNIGMKANVCSVKYNPTDCNYVAVGSADHCVYYYDLRNIIQPLYVFAGSKKAVSYVKFLSDNELASASTDNKLRLWEVKESLLVRTFEGHVNKKNFIGLTTNSQYIACGSETNEVFVYHKAFSKPVACVNLYPSNFHTSDDDDDESSDAGCHFVSSLCWKGDSSTVLAGNSQGVVKVLELAA